MPGTLVVGTLNNGTSPYNLANLGQTTAKAWVNFTDPGTLAITASYDVSSVTDVSTGRYKISFTNPMASDSYCVVGTASQGSSAANNTSVNVLAEDKSTGTRSPTRRPTVCRCVLSTITATRPMTRSARM